MSWLFKRPLVSSRGLSVVLVLGALALSAGAGSGPALASGRQFVLIASPDVDAKDITFDDLRRIFLFRKTTWNSRRRVRILLPETGVPARDHLLKKIYRTNDHGLKRLVLEKLFQGELDLAPKVVVSDEEAISFVKSSRGLIAIVGSQSPGMAGSRAIRIGGKLPGDPGYPLQD